MRTLALLVSSVLGLGIAFPVSQADTQSEPAPDFLALESSLEDVRQALRIPGMAVAVVQDQQLVWARGFGYADMERKIPASPDTPFGLASVTKPVAATLIMQLVEEGAIDLDAPVTSYGVGLPEGDEVTVRHLLTHTSEGTPGEVHSYNGGRYGLLGGVIKGATGDTFAELLSDRLLVPLGMTDTALNPLRYWGGGSLGGVEELIRTLGWGESFGHYPDVYRRMSRPYQFDEVYDLIPGKYHLYHNPAGGLISSVNDLAKFDIALDGGRLLGPGAQAEMLRPAVPTVVGRDDMAYGLGWYVQDLENTRLLWHAGRWAPSTSALYLKAPAENLTLIVLANTDNLTVPFTGIGSGDVSRSTLALTFFRHFLFPRQHFYEPPQIDWTAGQDDLVAQLATGTDKASGGFLERELWSFRQAFASSGQVDQAEVLRRASVTAFPESTLRSDPSYTGTAGPRPVIAPLPSARSLVLLSWIVMAWLVVVAVAVAWMIARLVRAHATAWEWTVWLSATVLLGPIALPVHRLDQTGDRRPSRSKQVLCASLFCVTGYALAWILAMLLLLNMGDDPNGLAILGATVLIPLTVGLLLIRTPLLRRGAGGEYGSWVFRGIPGEIITWSLGFAVFFPLTLFMDNRWLSIVPSPTSPFFWPMISFMALAGLVVFLPLHFVMSRRGFYIWPRPTPEIGPRPPLRMPTVRNSWAMLLLNLVIMVAVLGLSVSTFT